jgi:hypothetical protein
MPTSDHRSIVASRLNAETVEKGIYDETAPVD